MFSEEEIKRKKANTILLKTEYQDLFEAMKIEFMKLDCIDCPNSIWNIYEATNNLNATCYCSKLHKNTFNSTDSFKNEVMADREVEIKPIIFCSAKPRFSSPEIEE